MSEPRTHQASEDGEDGEDGEDDALPHGIGNPARRALAAIGVTRLDQVAAMTERELLALHGVGPKAVRILRETLAVQGRTFRLAEQEPGPG